MYGKLALTSLSLLAVIRGQQVGTLVTETHPRLTSQRCTTSGGCTNVQTSIVLDANWRWLHTTTGFANCYTGNAWDTTLCSSPTTCAQNCALDGADYQATYGITTTGTALTLKFVTQGQQKNVGSRVYLMADDNNYQMFNLKNQEFTMDVEVNNLPCGLNGAVYFSAMQADGGRSRYPNNRAGAKYGTGYCDSQCPHDIKFINGEANILDWAGSPSDPNAGTGRYGSCCDEMDIWEANSISTAYTPHPCTSSGPTRCSGTQCGDGSNRYGGICDKDGCDFNSYRLGDTSFYGPGKTVNTNSKMTVVTQFITQGNTASGDLIEIRRLYVQGGRVIQNSNINVPGVPVGNSINQNFCAVGKSVFGDTNDFQAKGGLRKMGQAFQAGMVLALSIWDDHAAHMLWLDSNYPLDKPATDPGVARGTCATTSGVPAEVEAQSPNASVTYSNIKWGDIGSTYPH